MKPSFFGENSLAEHSKIKINRSDLRCMCADDGTPLTDKIKIPWLRSLHRECRGINGIYVGAPGWYTLLLVESALQFTYEMPEFDWGNTMVYISFRVLKPIMIP